MLGGVRRDTGDREGGKGREGGSDDGEELHHGLKDYRTTLGRGWVG